MNNEIKMKRNTAILLFTERKIWLELMYFKMTLWLEPFYRKYGVRDGPVRKASGYRYRKSC